MRTTYRVGISLLAVFNTLLAGGCDCGYGEQCDRSPFEGEATLTLEEFESYLDENGMLGDEQCASLCDEHEWGTDGPGNWVSEWSACQVAEGADDTRIVTCSGVAESCSIAGRDSAHVASVAVGRGPSALGAWLAASAHAEAASVHAFLALRRELAEHGAPAELIDGALASARDEVMHARVCTRLARRRGASTPPARTCTIPSRDLEAIARENAVEGCVRETWAALVASHQARYASDPALRRAYRRIASDEARHAELAHAIDDWARERLDSAARERVDAARRDAVADLQARLGDPDPELVHWAGLPDRARARALVEALRSVIDPPVA